MYLVWCSHVNQSNRNERLTNVANMMPAVCEMDGHHRAKNFVLLDAANGKAKPLQVSNLTVETPYRKVLIWSCERTAEAPPEPRLAMLSEPEAIARVTSTIADTIQVPALQPAVATESDVEDQGDGVLVGDGDDLHFISSTPRVHNPF